jgi:hypothetical protein
MTLVSPRASSKFHTILLHPPSIYVNNFMFFSKDPLEETILRCPLKASSIIVVFIGTVDYFLGTAFIWTHHDDGNLSILLTQSTLVK